MEYLRGSEWRRWDLHIHTPCTNKNDQFSGTTKEEKWEKFYSDILSYIDTGDENHKVAVLGITDYFSVDNYLKIIEDEKITSRFQMILPNIEMRISPVSNRSAINIHFLVNPSFVPQLNTKVFSQLKFVCSNGITFHAVSDDFIKLGRSKKESATDEEAYKIGVSQFVVEFSNLIEILKDKDVRDNVLVAVSNGSNDGASGIGNPDCANANSDLSTLREELYSFSDLIFSSTKSTIDYFLGKDPKHPENEIKHKYGKLKPCIHGCDAHQNSQILSPNNDKYCWIKADCSFEGLKQVVYEPAERVAISCNKPDVKTTYCVIDKVIIENEMFSKEPIYFNPNLTCIIGGRSTGKSILLNNMARQIDKEQFALKSPSDCFKIDGLKVIWSDGFESDGKNESRSIVYVPQTYLNRLSDEQEEKTEIDDIIQNILLQDDEISDRYKTFENRLKDVKKELDKEILDLLTSFDEKTEIENTLKEHGNSKSIENEIQRLKTERDHITQSLNISDEDIKEYEALKEKIQVLDNSLLNMENDSAVLKDTTLAIDYSFETDSLSKETSKEIQEFIALLTSNINKEWSSKKGTILENFQDKKSLIVSELSKLRADLKEKEHLIERSEAVKKINERLQSELERFNKANEIEKELFQEIKKFEGLFCAIIHKIAIFDSLHQEFASFINQRTNSIDESIKFIASAPFRNEQFDAKVRTLFDNRKLRGIYCSFADGFSEDIDEASLSKLIKPLFNFDSVSYLKKGVTIEEVLRALLSNWYNIIYTVELDGDRIQTMSPGKKAIVLLKLLISLADAECPILIDQPEDDLDNRSIYDELVYFIKSKKKERQIIIVTHNANIVVGADTEEVIVANQQGANSPNEKYKFEYRSGSIENNNKVCDDKGRIKKGVLSKFGIQEHICEILEGGKEAFNLRKNKYIIIQ